MMLLGMMFVLAGCGQEKEQADGYKGIDVESPDWVGKLEAAKEAFEEMRFGMVFNFVAGFYAICILLFNSLFAPFPSSCKLPGSCSPGCCAAASDCKTLRCSRTGRSLLLQY